MGILLHPSVQGDAGHPGNRVVDKKRIIGKKWMAEEEAHGVTEPPKSMDILVDVTVPIRFCAR
jgi:hypothetical protein